MGLLSRIFRKKNHDPVIVVSGLPRSGTSMMMKMLEAGGIEPLTDNLRTPDDDNPKGYYEFERVKQLANDKEWLPEAGGKAVKIISALLTRLPPDYPYKVIFMQREMKEVLASQKKMLQRKGKTEDAVPDDVMAEKFQKHLREVYQWLESQSNIDLLYVKYNKVIEDPERQIAKINHFLNNILEFEKMLSIVDRSLYRQRV